MDIQGNEVEKYALLSAAYDALNDLVAQMERKNMDLTAEIEELKRKLARKSV